MNEQMREDFEAWYFDGAIDKAKERTPHGYKYIAAQASWLAWNAATLAEKESCALLCASHPYIDNGGEWFAGLIRQGTQEKDGIPFVMTAIFDDGVRIVKGVL